jgi:hypothetical protein
MDAAAYEFVTSEDCMNFKFWSEGPKGRIQKGVVFSRISRYSRTYFNLGFGNVDNNGHMDDRATSNNGDAEKVLATVARTVIIFTDSNPNALIYVHGSTPSRTRLYQMGINKFWSEIQSMFEIYGFTSHVSIEPFTPGINYQAFFGKRKKSYI